MSKQTKTKKTGESSSIVGRDSQSGRFLDATLKKIGTSPVASREGRTGQFVEAASRYAAANSASTELARAKLEELGIIDASGKLSKTYK